LIFSSILIFANGKGDSDSAMADTVEKVTISFGYAGGDPLVKDLTSQRVIKFMDENPDIEIIQMPSGSGAYLEFLKTKDAVGEFPDILDSRDTSVWVRADKLAELPESVVSLVKQAPLLDGKAYVAPISIGPCCGWYLLQQKSF
jgi:raffinose/stachyose/melibiose transport system substrate-binding protein